MATNGMTTYIYAFVFTNMRAFLDIFLHIHVCARGHLLVTKIYLNESAKRYKYAEP